MNFPDCDARRAAGWAARSPPRTDGRSFGNATAGSAGSIEVAPCSIFTGTVFTVRLSDRRPLERARTVIEPAVSVERTATRLMPHSRSSQGWLIELVLPLL